MDWLDYYEVVCTGQPDQSVNYYPVIILEPPQMGPFLTVFDTGPDRCLTATVAASEC